MILFIRDILAILTKWIKYLVTLTLKPNSAPEEPTALVLDKPDSSREDSVRQHHPIMQGLQQDDYNNNNNNSYFNNNNFNYNNNNNDYSNTNNNDYSNTNNSNTNYSTSNNRMLISTLPRAEFRHLILESPELYETVSLPYIKREHLRRLQWVENILQHRQEKERIILEDPNPDTGFILLPDRKWSGRSTSDLHCLAIVRQRGLKSLRDLRASHLPLLRNIRELAVAAVSRRYCLQASQLRCYIHYQPSHFHLHVHITSLARPYPQLSDGRIHLLDNVIFNILINNNHYQEATLPFKVRSTDKFYKLYKNVGHFEPPQLHQLPRPKPEEPGDFSKTRGKQSFYKNTVRTRTTAAHRATAF